MSSVRDRINSLNNNKNTSTSSASDVEIKTTAVKTPTFSAENNRINTEESFESCDTSKPMSIAERVEGLKLGKESKDSPSSTVSTNSASSISGGGGKSAISSRIALLSANINLSSLGPQPRGQNSHQYNQSTPIITGSGRSSSHLETSSSSSSPVHNSDSLVHVS